MTTTVPDPTQAIARPAEPSDVSAADQPANRQVPEKGLAWAGLTQMQTHIFISQGVSAYRLPFVYELGADETLTSVEQRLRATLSAAPSLACRYEHRSDGSGFVQRHAPELVESITVTDRGAWSGSLEQACASTVHAPDLRTGLPLAASLVTIDGVRHLVVEFHHIAIDGPGAALFEALFLADPTPEPVDAQTALAAYELVAAHERTFGHCRLTAALSSHDEAEMVEKAENARPDASGSQPLAAVAPARLGRLCLAVPTTTLRRFAREQRTFPRVALQAAFESWLGERHPGCPYAWVSSWRWTLDLTDVVGNFPVLLARPAPGPATLGERVCELMEHTGDPAIGADAEIADAAGVVFSYEDFRQGRGRYVPVDTFPRFALYFRIAMGPVDTELSVEFDRRLVSASLARDAIDTLADSCGHSTGPAWPRDRAPTANDSNRGLHTDSHQPDEGALRALSTEEHL